MFKNIMRQNVLPFSFIFSVYFFAMIFESQNHVYISQHLFLTILVPNIIFCFLFFLIPAKHPDLSFIFMFISEGIKFLAFALFFVLGLHYIHADVLNHFVLLTISCLILTMISTAIFFNHSVSIHTDKQLHVKHLH